MKTTLYVIVFILCCLIISNPVNAQQKTGNVCLFLGLKTFDNDWDPVEIQPEVGVLMDFGMDNWPINIAIDMLQTRDKDGDLEVSTSEINVGVRRNLNIRPWLNICFGGGLALISAQAEIDTGVSVMTDEDIQGGLWANFGIYWTFGRSKACTLGFNLRFSQSELELYSDEIEGGGLHTGATFGYHW